MLASRGSPMSEGPAHDMQADDERGDDAPPTPSVTVESMTFSDGTTVSINRDDVVVFVGPNNAGKTRALRDIEAHLSGATPGPVLAHVSFDKVGESPHVLAHVKRNSVMQEVSSGPPTASGLGYRLSLQNVDYFWTQQLGDLTPFFCLRIATETRITGSDPVASISFIDEPTTHPVHMLHQVGSAGTAHQRALFSSFRSASLRKSPGGAYDSADGRAGIS